MYLDAVAICIVFPQWRSRRDSFILYYSSLLARRKHDLSPQAQKFSNATASRFPVSSRAKMFKPNSITGEALPTTALNRDGRNRKNSL